MYGKKVKLRALFILILIISLILTVFLVLKSVKKKLELEAWLKKTLLK